MISEILHIKLNRLLYRVLAPKHPRGRTDMHAVLEENGGDTLWIHTHGMGALGFLEIELTGVPVEMRGYAHGILFDLMGYMAGVKPIQPDEDIGGTFVDQSQRIVHYATARLVKRPDDSKHTSLLRFVDYHCDVDSGFAPRLFAAHIAALADRERAAGRRETMSRLSIRAYCGSPEEWRREAEAERNPGNWLAFEILGHALCDQGRTDEGIQSFSEVTKRCPDAALRIANIYEDAIHHGHLPPPDKDARSRFWTSLDRSTLKADLEKRKSIGTEQVASADADKPRR